jgi:hypothetical protein
MARAFDELWQEYLEGELDAPGMNELDRLLADPASLRRAADLFEEHRLLGFMLRSPHEADAFIRAARQRVADEGKRFASQVRARIPMPAARSAKPRRPWLGYALVASIMFCAGLVLDRFVLRPGESGAGPSGNPGPVVQAAAETYVATLIQAVNPDGPLDTGLRPGRRLPLGTFQLPGGSALIRFDSGALAVLAGPSEMKLESTGGAALVAGKLTVRVPEEAAGFVLRTPASELIDQGSEFAVSVERSGATEVQILDGEVEWHQPGEESRSRILSGGQAWRFVSHDDREGKAVPLSTERFSELVPRISAAQGDGQLLSYEGFIYDAARAAKKELNGGFGWSGAWRRGNTGTSLEPQYLASESLPALPGVSAPEGGRLEIPVDPDRKPFVGRRGLSQPIDLDSDGTIYFSGLVRKTPAATRTSRQMLRFLLVAARDRKERVGFALMSDNHPQVMNCGNNTRADKALEPGKTYLFVGKLITARGMPNQVFLKVYGPDDRVPAFDPEDWTVTGRSLRSTAKLTELNVYAGPDCGFSVDEIRIGTSWPAVTTAGVRAP